MRSRPYAAFGNVIFVCHMDAGEEFPTQDKRRYGWRYITKGRVRNTYHDGRIAEGGPGTVEIDDDVISGRRVDFLEDTTWACLSTTGNVSIFTPQFSMLSKGYELKLCDGDEIFIAGGQVKTDRVITAPYALRVRGNDVTITATEDTYLCKFK